MHEPSSRRVSPKQKKIDVCECGNSDGRVGGVRWCRGCDAVEAVDASDSSSAKNGSPSEKLSMAAFDVVDSNVNQNTYQHGKETH